VRRSAKLTQGRQQLAPRPVEETGLPPVTDLEGDVRVARRDAHLYIARSNVYHAVMTVSTTRMREPTYFILAALQDEPLHGYAIIKRAGELSHGRVKLAAGTLYAALDRLTGEQLIQVVGEQVVNGRARRYYELTEAGRVALHAEAGRMAQAARVVTDHPSRSHSVRPNAVPA
jgi:PadR family transcriptional regulator PadR